MKISSNWFCPGLLALACLTHSGLAAAHEQLSKLSQCAWPIELSPEGYGNLLGPDDLARYWLVPFDTNYDTMKIEGSYPNARYFSFVVYNTNAAGGPASVAGHKYDAMIKPGVGTYTLCVTRDGAQCTNTINIDNNPVWVVYRIYVPSADKTLSGQVPIGGVPLPKVTLSGKSGSQVLEACPLTQDAPTQPNPRTHYYHDKSVNKLSDIRAFLNAFFPEPLDVYTPSDWYEAADDRLWFAPPRDPPPILGPNPDNKYIGMQPGPYQRGRIIVIHGKAPSFPNTNEGPSSPASSSGSPDTRYWSMCNYDLALPVPAVRCVTDQAAIIQDGYYTVVISDDLARPNWLQPNVNWLPWGDEQYPKVVFMRHMIPVARDDTNYTKEEVPFPYAIQWVVKGCPGNCEHKNAVVDFDLPYVPPRADFNAAGPHAQQIMGDYYPVAAWCDRSKFTQGGWQACIRD